jgi:hypothetical protein
MGLRIQDLVYHASYLESGDDMFPMLSDISPQQVPFAVFLSLH